MQVRDFIDQLSRLDPQAEIQDIGLVRTSPLRYSFRGVSKLQEDLVSANDRLSRVQAVLNTLGDSWDSDDRGMSRQALSKIVIAIDAAVSSYARVP